MTPSWLLSANSWASSCCRARHRRSAALWRYSQPSTSSRIPVRKPHILPLLTSSGSFPHVDVAFVLAFALIMLNTDAHNPAIADKDKMTKEQFVWFATNILLLLP